MIRIFNKLTGMSVKKKYGEFILMFFSKVAMFWTFESKRQVLTTKVLLC